MPNHARSARTLRLCAAIFVIGALVLPGSAGAESASNNEITTLDNQVWSALRNEPVPLVYRAPLQVAWGADWGNGKFYIADIGGARFVSVTPDGTIEELGISEHRNRAEPVQNVAFDPGGNLHLADGEKVYRVNGDGSITDLGVAALPNGGLDFDTNGDLYVAESHTGNLYRYRSGVTELITTALQSPADLSVGPDGFVYVTQSVDSTVVRIDPDDGTTTTLYDASSLVTNVPAYLTVDADGDIWAFFESNLLQISPSGNLKPFTVDGVTNDGRYTGFWWALTGGLGFDDDGNLWISSYNGSVIRLVSQDATPDQHDFAEDVIVRGYGPTDLTEASDGSIYSHNWMTGETWRFSRDGTHTVVWTGGPGDWVDFTADRSEPYIYLSTPGGEIITVDATGNTEHYAWVATSDLVTMSDGSLAAVQGGHHEGATALVRITGPDQVVGLTSELAGQPISQHELRIEPTPDGGLYAFSRTTNELFEVDALGNSVLLVDIDDLATDDRRPYLVTAGPDGTVYPYGYEAYRLTDSNLLELIALNTAGDPDAAVVSRDGSTLYIGEFGRISAIPLRAYDGRFQDDDGSVFESDIEWLAAAGITLGCNPPTNDRFCPSSHVTRGQMAAFLVRALDLTERLADPFTDDDGSTFEVDIEKLAASGITFGCNPPTNDRFCPDRRVTREQMAAFLVRALNLTERLDDPFTDDDGSIFEPDIERLAAAGITLGCNPPTNNLFCPGSPVTRAQMAAFLHRALS